MEIFIYAASALLFLLFVLRPQAGLYLLALSLPVIGFDFHLSAWDLPPVDLIAFILLAAYFVRQSYSYFFGLEFKKIKWPLFVPFAFFLGVAFISSLLSIDPSYSLWYFCRWQLFLYFAYIFLPYNLIRDQKVLKNTLIATALSSLIVLFFGLLSLYGQDWRDSFFRIRSVDVFGFYPFGDNHNLIAEFLNVGAFFILSLRFLAKDLRFRRLLDILFFLSALGIIMTFSRSGWIVLALQGAAYAWLYLRDNKFRKQDIYVFFLAGIIVLSPLVVKMAALQEKNVSSTENRVLLSEISLEAFSEKPILGYGSGYFIRLVEDNVRFRAKYGDPIDSHGSLQKVAAENGLFGIIGWLFIIVYLLRHFYLALREYGLKYPWLPPLLIGALGGLFFQFLNTSYYKGKVWLPITLAVLSIELVRNHYGSKKLEK